MNKIIDIMMIILICLSYFSYGNKRGLNIHVGYYFPFVVGAIFCVLALILYIQRRRRIDENLIKSFVMLLIPEIMVTFSTIFLWILLEYEISYITRSISNILLYIFPIIQGLFIVYLYKEKAVDIIFKGSILNYTLIIVIYILNNGFYSLFQTMYLTLFANTDIMTILEAHQVTFVLSLFLIYYCIYDRKKNKKRIIITIFYLLLGFKRILVLGLLSSLLIVWFINRIKDKKVIKIVIILFTLGILFCSYFWIYGLKNGIIEMISNKYSINFMSRFKLYTSVNELYEFEPLFLGKGIGFVSKWNTENTGRTIGLHSDLLKKYIEYGFFMFGVYIIYRTWNTSNKIYKYSGKKALSCFFAIMITTIICWITDNVAGYYVYTLTYSVIVLQIFNQKGEYYEEKNRDINVV